MHNRTLVKGHTVGTCTPRFGSTSIPAPLDRRQGRSCEFNTSEDDRDRHDRFNNPIAQVSSDILRVSGYTQQFRSLLTARFPPRRESTPNVNIESGDENQKLTGDIDANNKKKAGCHGSQPIWLLIEKCDDLKNEVIITKTMSEKRKRYRNEISSSVPMSSSAIRRKISEGLPPIGCPPTIRRSTITMNGGSASNSAAIMAVQHFDSRRFSAMDNNLFKGRRRSSKMLADPKQLVHIFTNPYDRFANGSVRFDNEIIEESGSGGQLMTGNGGGGGGQIPGKPGIRRRQSGYGIAISSDSTAKMRCRLRKQLFIRRNKVCDVSLILALVGLFLIIIDSEFTALAAKSEGTEDIIAAKGELISIVLRSICVFSTILLIICLINYHAIEVKIALIDSGADDWRVALSTDRMIKLLIEIFICMICPFPGSGVMQMPYIDSDSRKISIRKIPVDVILSVPMFLRSYLVCRFMVLHSKQFQDAATRSIAALNRISMDFRFVIKTMMADHPLRVLIVFTLSYWICMSWMFTQCERYDGGLTVEHYYLNSMWFIMVTFMSIGYGDIVPNTYCGRCLSITTGIVGAGVSSALIAIISRKLELSRAEKHVNNFMADSKLTNQRKNAAASVLQETWFIHKYKKALHKGDDLRLRHHQRRFLNSINEFRRIKWDQRKLQEKGNSLLDVGKLHSDMHETLWEMHRTQDHFISQIDILTQKIIELQTTLNSRPPCCPPTNSSDAYYSTTSTAGALQSLQSPMLHCSQSHREPLQVTSQNESIPRISVATTHSGTSSGASSANGILPQCTVDQISNCPTGGIYATVTTPLITNYEEV
ncbi:unnamed protein product [Caenorhabditis angaria]|uniref:Calmodulin-binding domain-containing protein n=1 Tax=Caenorhabditis angaria TaxID=860376 RepID=A0A9P1N7G4_9PELO|nr:unnamed protein product [Caenorhabditis angaria]